MNYLNMNEEDVLPVVMELNILLADYHIYYQKLRSNHWNVNGKNFFDLHDKFEELYNHAQLKIDAIAERVLTLRYNPMSKMKDYLKAATIHEDRPIKSDHDMVEETLNDHKILLNQMSQVIVKAEQISDEGTIDLIGAYIRELEKSSWMLSAWLTRKVDQPKHRELQS
ncbi:MAG: DNA starvation/stationary phase protection protein [Algibacter sp.]|uniref:Dps family protein n=1 Tax=Algibacter sp. TaxID=1872428 RepID=UPI003296986A